MAADCMQSPRWEARQVTGFDGMIYIDDSGYWVN